MKLNFVLQRISGALLYIDKKNSEELVKQYLSEASAELRKFRVATARGLACSDEEQQCPFLEWLPNTGKQPNEEQYYCVLSKRFLKKDERGFFIPDKGCAWQE